MLADVKSLLDDLDLAQPWAMQPERLEAFVRGVAAHAGVPLVARSLEPRDENDPGYELRGSVAVIPITGVMMRKVPSWMRYFGMAATSTTELRSAVERAAADNRVRKILLRVDSPGGEARGTLDAAEAILAARAVKRVDAAVEGLCASGAYWLASQAHEITAPADSEVGSIGCYSVVADFSKMAEREGVTVHVIRSGPHKGAGTFGAPITPEQLAAQQQIVDGIAGLFTSAIVVGRRRTEDQVKAIATGQTWLGRDAHVHGLVDRVEPAARALLRLAPPPEGLMSQTTNPTPAAGAPESQDPLAAERKRVGDLYAAFPDEVDAAFVRSHVVAGSSVDAAQVAYSNVLRERLTRERAEHATAIEQAKKAGMGSSGSTMVGRTPTPAVPNRGDPAVGSGDFIAAAKALAAEKGIKVTAAMQELAHEQPNLHAAFKNTMRERAPEIHARKRALGMEAGSGS